MAGWFISKSVVVEMREVVAELVEGIVVVNACSVVTECFKSRVFDAEIDCECISDYVTDAVNKVLGHTKLQ